MEHFALDEPQKLFERFQKMNILIIGDVMIDSYLFGKVERISPEAPVPVVSVKRRTNRLGGAANVALNVRAMGANPILCSVIGADEKAETFLMLMKEHSLMTEGLLKSRRRITTTKFRVIGNNTQMLRVDEEITSKLDDTDNLVFRETIQNLIERNPIDAIIFQDYDKGVINPLLIKFVIELAHQKNIPVTVDPKKENFSAYRNVSVFKPNLKELQEGLSLNFDKSDTIALREAIRRIHKAQDVETVMVTLSEAGVFISKKINDDVFDEHHLPAHLRTIADVSGAGDTVISVAALALAAGLTIKEIASLSNLAGGLVCENVGVVPIERHRLLNEISK
jgi:D-glycero-beta-D-manno-heptose-7-phosphate kinase